MRVGRLSTQLLLVVLSVLPSKWSIVFLNMSEIIFLGVFVLCVIVKEDSTSNSIADKMR